MTQASVRVVCPDKMDYVLPRIRALTVGKFGQGRLGRFSLKCDYAGGSGRKGKKTRTLTGSAWAVG